MKVDVQDEWDYFYEPWEVAEQRVIDAVRTELRSQRGRIMNSAKDKGEDTPNVQRDFVSHVQWTFKRIARKESWSAIAKNADFSIRTVRDAVGKMLDRLGIEPPFEDEIIPSSPPGRPRKFQ